LKWDFGSFSSISLKASSKLKFDRSSLCFGGPPKSPYTI